MPLITGLSFIVWALTVLATGHFLAGLITGALAWVFLWFIHGFIIEYRRDPTGAILAVLVGLFLGGCFWGDDE